VNIEGKKSERAKIITKDYGALKDNKNGYILFKEKESVTKALELNQTKLGDKHIRVDTLKGSTVEKKEGQKGGASEDDFKTTVFVGNLPYVVSEEEVREHFAKFGTIKNVRLVRDAKSHIGKGIGFVMFDSEEELRAAIAGAVKFSGRELRLKKATDPKKREKKANRKEAALEERREKRRQAKKQDEESEDDINIQEKLANYSSDDSEDEKPKKKSASNIPKVPDLSDTKTFEKMTSGVDRGADRELKMQNTISFN
jgi:nucleolar protein 12